MRDSSTNRDVLSDVLAEPEGVVRKNADRNAFHCPPEHRKSKASADIWLDVEVISCVRCHDCGHSSELWQHIVGPDDDAPGRVVGEAVRWATT